MNTKLNGIVSCYVNIAVKDREDDAKHNLFNTYNDDNGNYTQQNIFRSVNYLDNDNRQHSPKTRC